MEGEGTPYSTLLRKKILVGNIEQLRKTMPGRSEEYIQNFARFDTIDSVMSKPEIQKYLLCVEDASTLENLEKCQ